MLAVQTGEPCPPASLMKEERVVPSAFLFKRERRRSLGLRSEKTGEPWPLPPSFTKRGESPFCFPLGEDQWAFFQRR